jgi:hypothetical protein
MESKNEGAQKAANNYTQWESPEPSAQPWSEGHLERTESRSGKADMRSSIKNRLVAHTNIVRTDGNNENIRRTRFTEIKSIDALW